MVKATCVSRGGYGTIRYGEQVIIVKVLPSVQDVDSGFVWPEYTVVQTADGKEHMGHSYRFKPIQD